MHSCAKPLQLLPVLELGLDKEYQLNDEELAFMTSSHFGQSQHMDVFSSILRKTGLQEQQLLLPPSAPCGTIAYENWLHQHNAARPGYHPCAGNHLAVMLAQRALTGSTDGYTQVDSPIQTRIATRVSEYSGVPFSEIEITPDGCGLPAYTLPVSNIARIYQRLSWENSTVPEIEKMLSAIHHAPRMIEGDGCISTILNQEQNLIAKTGAGGLLTLGLLEQKTGIVIASSEGWHHVVKLLIRCLSDLGAMTKRLDQTLQYFLQGSY